MPLSKSRHFPAVQTVFAFCVFFPKSAVICVAIYSQNGITFAARFLKGIRSRSTFSVLFYANIQSPLIRDGYNAGLSWAESPSTEHRASSVASGASHYRCGTRRVARTCSLCQAKNCAKGRSREALDLNRDLDRSYALYLRGRPRNWNPYPHIKNAPRHKACAQLHCGWNAVSDFPFASQSNLFHNRFPRSFR